MPWRSLAEWAGFQAVWFACALGAAQGLNWPGVAAAALFLLVTLAGRGWSRPLVVAVLASGAFGAVGESLLSATGLLLHAADPAMPGVAPAWIIALWLAFGATVPAMQALLGSGLRRAALVGAVAGPLAYVAGARLGALQFPAGLWPAVAAIGLIWALALPLLMRAHRPTHR